MKKLLFCIVLSVMLVFSMTACGNNSSDVSEDTKSSKSTTATKVTYDSIYDEYSSKIKDAGKTALDEYKNESAGETDVTKLATLVNEKITAIAKVQVEGGTKMAELMTKNGDEYSAYEEAFNKLYQVYNDEALNVYGAYISQYADTIPGMTDEMKQQMINTYEESLKSMAPMQEK